MSHKAFSQSHSLNKTILNARLFWICIFIISDLCVVSSKAQWVEENSKVKKMVSDLNNPQNIISISDGTGGGFIAWEDDKIGTEKIFFLHFDKNGNPTHRADGKNVSQFGGKQFNPAILLDQNNEVVICWNGTTERESNNLFIQKVSANGGLLWGVVGIQLTNSVNGISEYEYSIGSDNIINVAYISDEPGILSSSSVNIASVLAQDNKKIVKHVNVYTSNYSKNSIRILCIGKICFVFWEENINGRVLLHGFSIDENGKPKWGTQPITITSKNRNVHSYQVQMLNNKKIYLTWQYSDEMNKVYHQLISLAGKSYWSKSKALIISDDEEILNFNSNTYNEQVFVSYLTTSEDRNSLIFNKINPNSNLSTEEIIIVAKNKSISKNYCQFLDKSGSVFLVWSELSEDSLSTKIMVQKFNSDGTQIWKDNGVTSYYSSSVIEYSVFSDNEGGLINVYRDSSDNKTQIFGKRIYKSGSAYSNLLSLTAENINNNVLLNWFTEGINDSDYFIIERRNQEKSDIGDWEYVNTIYIDSSFSSSNFQYFDNPDLNGTIYYKVTHLSSASFEISNNVARVNNFKTSNEVVVAQNIPNPFDDSTLISFYLPESTNVTIEFFNSNLEEIVEIKNEFPEGKNEIVFNANGLRSGIYFYKLTAGEVTEVKKMVVAK